MDIVHELKDYQVDVDVYDPWVNAQEAQQEYGLTPIDLPGEGQYDAIILAVAHQQFIDMGEKGIRSLTKPGGVIYVLKYNLPAEAVDLRL